MNSAYEDFIRQVGDQWVAAVKQAQEAYAKTAKAVTESTPNVKMPAFAAPEQVTKLGESLSQRLPKPAEIIEANFELSQRLLTAQRDLMLSLVARDDDSAASGEESPAASGEESPAASGEESPAASGDEASAE